MSLLKIQNWFSFFLSTKNEMVLKIGLPLVTVLAF